MIHAIILAGGFGTRFWPLSRAGHPKQFLNLYSHRPLLEETILRFSPLLDRERIMLATNRIYGRKAAGCLRRLNIRRQNIFFEPVARNTFAPIGILTKKIWEKDQEAVIIVSPCDHYIREKDKFLATVNKAVDTARQGYIVTIGVVPDRPETGYGYIKIRSKVKGQGSKFSRVEKFVEKPSLELAKMFIKDKRYYWNAGIFVFRADVMLGEIKHYALREFQAMLKIDNTKKQESLWKKFPSLSIDYAIMEKSKKIALVPAGFHWSDLGSWQALGELLKKDKNGNVVAGNCINLDCRNILAWSDKAILAVIGLDNLIIVNTQDALLVCAKDRAQEVKSIAQILKDRKLYQQL